jgi:hypothetical protein
VGGRLRALLGVHDEPLLWWLSLLAAVGIGGGMLIGTLLGPARLAIGTAVAAFFVAVAGSVLPRPTGRFGALIVALGAVALAVLAALVAGRPVAAGVAMALVALVSGVLIASGGPAALLGLLIGNLYVVPAAVGTGYESSVGKVALATLAGAAWGYLVAAVVAAFKTRRSGPVGPAWTQGVRAEVRRLARDPLADPRVRYGLRRGIALGIGMAIYEASGDRDALWVLFTIFVVLQPEARASLQTAGMRVLGTFLGLAALGLLTLVLEGPALLVAGLLALDLGVAWLKRAPAVLTAATTIFAVALTEVLAPGFTDPAGHRLADTLIGAAIAVVVGYVLFPARGRQEEAAAASGSAPSQVPSAP